MEAKPQIHSFHTTKSILLKLAFYPMCGLYHHSNQPTRKRTYIAKHTVASSQESSTQETTLEDIESNHPPLEHVNFDSQKMAKIIPTSSQHHPKSTSSQIIPNICTNPIPSLRPRCCTTDLPNLAGLEPKGRRLVGLHPLRRALQLQPAGAAAACALGDGAGGRSR